MLFRRLRDMIGQDMHYCFSDNLLCFAAHSCHFVMMLGSDGSYSFMSPRPVCVFVLEAGDVDVYRQRGLI